MINRILSSNLPLSTFRSTSPNPPQIFPESQQFPSFFSRHLLHPNRRIKCFRNDPNALIRAFYFQYLMLCYEIENQNYGIYIEKIKRFVLDENFSFLFLETDTDEIYNDLQFKRIILQFMDVLDSGEFPTTELALNYYPILDTVYVYFFRSLAIYAEITPDFDSYVDKNIMFGFLLENFGIDAQVFEEKCVKFIEAQVFVYQESFEEVYMVYKDIQTSSSGIGQEGLDIGSQYSRESQENGIPIGGSYENLEKSLKDQYEQNQGLYNMEGSVHENVSCLEEQNWEAVSSQKLGWKKQKGNQYQSTQKMMSISNQNSHLILNSPNHTLEQSPLPIKQQSTLPLSNNDYCLKLNGLSLSPSIDQLIGKKQQISDGLKTEAKTNSDIPSYSDQFVSTYELPKQNPIINAITNTTSSVTVSIQNYRRDNDIKYPESISYLMNKDYGTSLSHGNANSYSNNQYMNKNNIPTTTTKQSIQGSSRIENLSKQQIRLNQIPTRDISSMFPALITTTIQSRQSLTHRLPKMQQPIYATQSMGRQFREDSLRLGNKFRETVMAKLSVSKEFTDSWILMKMGEPYRSNVKNIKARSRQFRQSIINSFL